MAKTVRIFFTDSPKFEGYELAAFISHENEIIVQIKGDDIDHPYNLSLIPLDIDTAKSFVKELNRLIKQAEIL